MDINLNLTPNQLIESSGDYEIVQGENGLDIQPMGTTSETRITTTNVRLMEVDKPPTLPSNIGKKINGTFRINVLGEYEGGTLDVTENGTYKASDEGIQGYEIVNVNVPPTIYQPPIVTKIAIGNISAGEINTTVPLSSFIYTNESNITLNEYDLILIIYIQDINYKCITYYNYDHGSSFDIHISKGYYHSFKSSWTYRSYIHFLGSSSVSNEEKFLLTFKDYADGDTDPTIIVINRDLLSLDLPDTNN